MTVPPMPDPSAVPPTSPAAPPPGLPEGYLERWMERRRSRRRRVVWVLGVAVVLAVVLAWGAWYLMHRHWMAASALRLDGLTVQWDLSDGAWKHGGSTHVANTGWMWMPGNIQGEDLHRLADLRHLETLSLAGCLDVADDDLSVLGKLPELTMLDLSMTRPHPSYTPSPLTDAMLAHLRGLNNLEELNLVDVNITDRGLARFPDLPKLRYLDLTGTAVTDKGSTTLLDHLPALETLALTRTAVTKAGVEALWRARPGLIVLHDSVPELPLPAD